MATATRQNSRLKIIVNGKIKYPTRKQMKDPAFCQRHNLPDPYQKRGRVIYEFDNRDWDRIDGRARPWLAVPGVARMRREHFPHLGRHGIET